MISDVIPWESLLNARLSMSSEYSDWPSISMKPGETTRPEALMTFFACAFTRLPIAAMRSPRIAMSPETHGLPEPSMIWP